MEVNHMSRLFLSILEGESPGTARPLFASSDAGLIRAVAEQLSVRMGLELHDAERGSMNGRADWKEESRGGRDKR